MFTETMSVVNRGEAAPVKRPELDDFAQQEPRLLDDKALYFQWLEEKQRRELAEWFQLEETASWEEIGYHAELANAERLEIKRLAWVAMAQRNRYVVPEQDKLSNRLGRLLTEHFYNDLNRTRTHFYGES